MPAPTNTAATTATVIASLPYDVVQTGIHDAGTTYTVWYTYTAVSPEVVIGVFGFGDLTTYRPSVAVFTGPASAPVQLLSFVGIQNRAIQVPVTAGTQYFFRFSPNAGNPTPATLTLNVQTAPADAAIPGALIVNDDSEGYPLAILSSTTGEVVRFVSPFPNGEAGDTLANGTMLFEDFGNDNLRVYDNTFTLIATLQDLDYLSPRIRTCLGGNCFFVGSQTNPVQVKVVTSAGAFEATEYTLTGITSLMALAASNDRTILYHSDDAAASPLRRWDLVGGAALSDLAAGIANRFIVDILVLSDNTIIFSSVTSTAVADQVRIKIYSAAGALLQDIDLGTTAFPAGTFPRLAYAVDDPASFWVWTHTSPSSTGVSRFRNVRVSDGAVLATVDATEYEVGAYQPTAETATPAARFGNSFSCPFMVYRSSSGTSGGFPGPPGGPGFPSSGPGVPGIPSTTIYPIRRLRRAPHISDEQVRIRHHAFQLDLEAGLGLTTGQGDDPQLMLRWSDDGGHSWSVEYWVSAGKKGEYRRRAIWRRLGMSRDRVYEVTISDPVRCTWIDAFLTLGQTSS
jgi:hypothetical protein